MQKKDSNPRGLTLRLVCIIAVAIVCLSEGAQAAVTDDAVKVTENEMLQGGSVDLTGKWLYRPGYSIGANEKPESALSGKSFSVPVPQLLNRIRWWLDDSEDFNKHETERLKALGFDTDRAQDGWVLSEAQSACVPVFRARLSFNSTASRGSVASIATDNCLVNTRACSAVLNTISRRC